MVDLSIIIVSYNVKDFLTQCIKSIERSNFKDRKYEIIIVDNDSHDGTQDLIKQSFDNIKFIQNTNNLGFSKAVNLGISKSSGKYICLLNPDVIVDNNCFSDLLNKIDENENIGCIGPKILNTDGTIQHSCKRSFPTPLNSFFRLFGLDKLFPKSKFFSSYNLTYLNIDVTHSVESLSGAFMIFRKKIIEEIGLLDENFFMFGEDIDFCHRIKSKGYSIIYYPRVEIIHYKGESVKSSQYDMVSVFYDSMKIYFNKYSKNYPSWKIISFFVYIGLFIRKLISYIKIALSSVFSSIIDTVLIFGSFSFGIYLWYTHKLLEYVDINKILYHWPLIFNFLLCWYFISYLTQLYKQNHLAYTRLFFTLVLTFMLSSTTTYFFSFFAYSRGVLILSCSFVLLLSFIWRIIINSFLKNGFIKSASIKRFSERRAIIVGLNNENINIEKHINTNPYTNINIIGFTDYDNHLLVDNFLGKIKYIKEIIVKNKINELIVSESFFNSNKIFDIIKLLKGSNVIFKIIPKNSNIIISKGHIEQISGVDLMTYEIPFLERSNMFLKRSFDIIFSFLLLILISPIFVIFFNKIKKERIWCIDNTKINLYIFRSKFKSFKYIPSLFNVLNGQISFVGSDITNSLNENPNHILKSGLISLYNVKRFKNNDRNKINSYYIKHQSLTFDLEIIIKSLLKI
tara:strand:- start:1731 stop:3779 length:2049 start_codon:yes stop_codon:yes gene_type:complete